MLSLTDLKNDGNNYLLYTFKNKSIAKSINGNNADNFPFTDKQEIGFTGNVISADFFGSNNAEIFSVTKDGRIYAIDGNTSNVVEGFPIMMGNYSSSTLSYFTMDGKGALAVIDDQNYFYIWTVASTSGDLIWSEENGNANNTNYLPAAKNINIVNSFLPKDRSYNYPNPVYGSATNIRYFVNEDSKITIKIFDISGAFVTELINTAQGGFDNETVWNVSNIQSGVYLAIIEAVGNSGKTETNIIKIAVVK
ncbi:MAG: T9SS type A sorting domain-containing protein [Bacteroidetes bacterium]|nr:T9SS type A sorting domain-containing protein [Bacteroidota bacterium]